MTTQQGTTINIMTANNLYTVDRQREVCWIYGMRFKAPGLAHRRLPAQYTVTVIGTGVCAIYTAGREDHHIK